MNFGEGEVRAEPHEQERLRRGLLGLGKLPCQGLFQRGTAVPSASTKAISGACWNSPEAVLTALSFL